MQYPGLYNSLRFYSTENYIRKELRLLHSRILPSETWDMKWPVWSAKNNSLLFRVASESRGIASPRGSLRTNHVCSVRSSILYPLLQSARGTDYGLLVGNIYHNYGDKVVLHAHENCVLFIISCVVCTHCTLMLNLSTISDDMGVWLGWTPGPKWCWVDQPHAPVHGLCYLHHHLDWGRDMLTPVQSVCYIYF